MLWFSSRIQKQRVIPVFRGGKRMYSGVGAMPRKDRNPVLEAVDAGLDAFVVFLEKGLGYSLQRAESGFRSFRVIQYRASTQVDLCKKPE